MDKLRVSRSIVGNEEAAAVARVLLSDGYLGMGEEVQRFEEELAVFLGIDSGRVACVSSGTAALQLAVESLLEAGDEVLVQSLTFAATFQAILAAGALPIACEVRPDTVTIDLEDAERRLTNRTRAIVPVHYASNPGDLETIYKFAARHGLRVIEDAAHAFGCTYKGRKIGSFGDVQCFSFDGIKNITSGEGGAIVTSDPLVLRRVKDARLLGIEHDTEKRFARERSWEFDIKRGGYRYHMSNVLAAIGRVQLKRLLPEFAPQRLLLARRYRERLSSQRGVVFLDDNLGSIIPHIQPVRITTRRDALRLYLRDLGIETGIHYKPNHLLTLFRTPYPLKTTEQLYKELLSLPLHPGLTLDDIDRVCASIIKFLSDKK